MSALNLLNAVFLFSGGASTCCNLYRACQQGGQLYGKVDPRLAITNNPRAGGITKLQEAGMPKEQIVVLTKKMFGGNVEAWAEALLQRCQGCGVDFVGQYGWTPMTPRILIEAFRGMMVNQHPGIVPEFAGLHGMQVHDAVITFMRSIDQPWTKAIAQRVSPDVFDAGAVLHQSDAILILPEDDLHTLPDKVKVVEWQVQIDTLEMFADGRVRELEPHVPLATTIEEKMLLDECKKTARLRWPNG